MFGLSSAQEHSTSPAVERLLDHLKKGLIFHLVEVQREVEVNGTENNQEDKILGYLPLKSLQPFFALLIQGKHYRRCAYKTPLQVATLVLSSSRLKEICSESPPTYPAAHDVNFL